jgi:hypothetical protein
MRGVVHVAATALAALAAGCATSVDVSFDDTHDFSRYRTWDWLPHGRRVDVVPGEEHNLDALTSQLVARELQDRGLVRESHSPDVLVSYHLGVRRRLWVSNETGATDYLASHHSSPSYLVQSSWTRVDSRDYGDLYVVMTNGERDRVVWRGRASGQGAGRFERQLDRVVSELFERFPAGTPGALENSPDSDASQ